MGFRISVYTFIILWLCLFLRKAWSAEEGSFRISKAWALKYDVDAGDSRPNLRKREIKNFEPEEISGLNDDYMDVDEYIPFLRRSKTKGQLRK